MAEEKEDGFPMSIYVFDDDGKHNGAILIANNVELEEKLDNVAMPMLKTGREVVIADCWDSCVYHAKDGKVIWPTEEMVKKSKP
jgi:hypothetical protein